MLRTFEVSSGLGVNYNKCRLVGVNLFDHFLEAVVCLLSFRIEKSSFNFLGILIGCNPELCSTCNPLIWKLNAKLDNWKNRCLSLGVRITLLKYVLSSISIFHILFHRAPKKVCRDIQRIQFSFL